jgi:hypothetical protein
VIIDGVSDWILDLLTPYTQLGTTGNTIIVFSPDSPATRSRGSIGSGGESSSMLTSVEGNAVQAFCTRKNASN